MTGGCVKNFEYHLFIDPTIRPVVKAPRKIPIELKKKLERKLGGGNGDKENNWKSEDQGTG